MKTPHYDDLASHYSKSRLPGVGISIGLTRLFWQLREAGLVLGSPQEQRTCYCVNPARMAVLKGLVENL